MGDQAVRIAVMGSGGVGGCLGGLLAGAGADVTLIARGVHLSAMRRDGLRLVQQADRFTMPVNATGDPYTIDFIESPENLPA